MKCLSTLGILVNWEETLGFLLSLEGPRLDEKILLDSVGFGYLILAILKSSEVASALFNRIILRQEWSVSQYKKKTEDKAQDTSYDPSLGWILN